MMPFIPIRRLAKDIEAKELPFYPKNELLTGGYLPRAQYHYGIDVRDGLDSNVLMGPIMWIMRVFTEARAVMQSQRGQTGVWDNLPNHPLSRLIKKPNPFYSASPLWKPTIISYILDGNAYWLKRRNAFGDVVELWYAPHWAVKPITPPDRSTFITHYEYTPGGETLRLAPRDVVHFRFGMDPRNPVLGYGALRPLLREVFVDEEAASFATTLLVNQAVPGLVISPAGSDRLTPSQAADFKTAVEAATSGANRGSTLALGWPAKADQYGFDPNQMMLGNLRDISEERVCALIGIPAAVVGFGSGLQSTKVGATMKELMKAAWTTCIMPMQGDLGEQIDHSLVPDFVTQVNQFRMGFDRSDVSAFQEDKDATVARAEKAVLAGILRIDRAQEMCGFEVDPKRAIYLTPSGTQPVDKSGKPIEMPDDKVPDAVAARLGNGNGNGSNPEDEE